MIIGELKEIVRHPIKSFRGENVQQTFIASYGLYGDRSHAFLDETRPGKYLTATQLPEMIGYTASFIGEETLDTYPSIKIVSPEGKYISGEIKSYLQNWNKNQIVELKAYNTHPSKYL